MGIVGVIFFEEVFFSQTVWLENIWIVWNDFYIRHEVFLIFFSLMFDIYAVGITSGWRKANKTLNFFGIVISLYFCEWSWNNGVCYLKECFFL